MEENDSNRVLNDDNDVILHGEKEASRKLDDDGKKRLRSEIESLHKEMEVTGYAKGKSGRRQRKLPRDVSKVRTQKRKLLEKLDESELAILGDEDVSEKEGSGVFDRRPKWKRLRGSKVAGQDAVIQGSLIFSTVSLTCARKGDNSDPDSKDTLCDATQNMGRIRKFEEHESGLNAQEDEDTDTEYCETATTKTAELEGQVFDQSQNNRKPGSKLNTSSKKKRRKMYRLRNFQSLKMAQKHGSAIAAHARGKPRLAIEQLKSVAKAAPSAPQVYSSLGMVYEDMLRESRNRFESHPELPGDTVVEESTRVCTKSDDLEEVLIPHRGLSSQRILATKAYGSYHVAAILCKRDFTLWVRAADAALAIAEVHTEVINLPKLSKKLCEYHRTERRRWQDEALRDYIVADNLKPPGIDVPAKLAFLHMELGNLSEALTILTDLKNRAGCEFQSSYKAWMLYSDLMLRLGHECIQWSKGIQTNENYMFRRWLRKFSKTFDWQERRLQGLSLAFEAAAGTENAKAFLAWIRKRIIETAGCATKKNSNLLGKEISAQSLSRSLFQGGSLESKQSVGRNVCVNETSNDEIDNSENEITNTTEPLLAKEKNLLMLTQSRELESFDKTTIEMDLESESAAAKGREIERNLLLKSHDAAITKLLKEFDDTAPNILANEKDERIMGMNESPLPISGSIKQVCCIASELMKHLLGLELYEGAKLVGDTVSCYMKQRAQRHLLRIEAEKKASEWQQKLLDSPLFLDSYDDSNVSNNENDFDYLSDEEILLDGVEDSSLVESLSKGALTPELRVLYGLALIGRGGRNFIAAKCLEAIGDLQQEPEEWFSDSGDEMNHTNEPFWFLFRRAMTEELARTGAYAFTADILKRTNKECEWAFHFSSSFRDYLKSLSDRGLIEKLLNLRGRITPIVNFKRNQLLKVILVTCRFDIYTIEKRKEIKYVFNKSLCFDRPTQMRIAQAVLASVASIVPLVWSIEGDGALSPICIEIVKVVAQCLKWLSSVVLDEMSYSALKNSVDHCTTIVSYLCGSSIPGLKNVNESEMPILEGTKQFPVQSSWQSSEFRMLSICTYNFAIACNVSIFSGWESEEFTMKVLKKRFGQDRHLGVHIGDKRLAGCLPNGLEDELNRQWKSWKKLQPAFPKLDFAKKLQIVKRSEWFQLETRNREKTLGDGQIALYAEEDALNFFLSYAALCTYLSRSETDKRISNRCLQIALSILLPLSQFCLDERLWDSDIGEAATTVANYERWQLLAGNAEYQPVGDREGLYPKRIRKSGKRVFDKKVQEWIEGAGCPSFKDFIPIPNVEFKKLWMQTAPGKEETKTTDPKMQMQKVHKALVDLRSCYTYAAAEKACLNLSVALLEMAEAPCCHDPFNCLQQAASFASQATKSGNSDTLYRRRLPEMTRCSPREALVILGRADCLQAVYFPNEAAYLCSFVARVCRLHRDSTEVNFEWSDRWKVVAIYAYNVSVMIRIAVSGILNQASHKAFMAAWERDVVEELERARRDGKSWMNTLAKVAAGKPVTNFDSPSAGILENFKGLGETGQYQSIIESEGDSFLQENKARSLSFNVNPNIEIKPDLTETKGNEFGTESNDWNEIVQYSV